MSSRESVEGHYVPNAGFLEDVVFEDPSLLSTCQASDSCEVDKQNGITKEGVTEHIAVRDAHMVPGSSSATLVDMKNATAEQVADNVSDLKLEDVRVPEELNVDENHALSTEDVDTLLDKCLLQALHTTVKDKDLPIPGSTLW